jgi:hypothetical protein
MSLDRSKVKKSALPVNKGRHEAQCRICQHAQRLEIEAQFIGWKSPDKIGKTFGICRDSIYRHCRAFNLLEQRRRNLRAALEGMIERSGEVELTSSAVVAAIVAYSKLNSNGQLIERRESLNLNGLFERMSQAELRRYAESGALPAWFTTVTGAPEGATTDNSQETPDER